ncbi:MAG TPA: sigma-70 family RNA polymerase sigma factor [Planctomycetota bacterium]
MTIEEGPALSEPAPGPASALDPQELCAQVDWLRAVSRSLVRDPWRAEDVAQETLLAALNAPPRSAGDVQHVRAWLGRVAFNLSRLGARRAARQQAREVRVARRESLPPVTEELELAGTARLVEEAIATLPGPYQSVVRLRYFEGHSTAAIAAHLGTSELAVRKRLWRARSRLRATLERGGRREPFWVTLLFLRGRELGAPGLTALAAGVAASVGGLAWWLGGAERPPAHLTEVARAGVLAPEGAAAGRVPASTPASADLPADPGTAEPRRELRPPVPERGPRNEIVAPQTVSSHGLVLDLEGRPRADLAIHRAGAPEELLATTDAHGRFTLARRGPLELLAVAGGWTTLVPGTVVRGSEEEPARIVVAPSADLALLVVDPRGEPVPGASVELRCEALAFTALDFAVRLPAPVLRTGASDAAGALELPELPRGRGLVLRVAAEGFEPLERATLELGAHAWLALQPERVPARLAGTVFHRDGRPAAGARVELAEASAVADARGRYHLPLRGVERGSGLTAVDPDQESAPLELERFGARLEDWRGTLEVEEQPDAPVEHALDLVLGAHLEHVAGELVGRTPEGWLVAAFAREAGAIGDVAAHETPAATTRSDASGAFALRLVPGAYDLYALAPAGACVVARAELVTGSAWRLVLPDELPLRPAQLQLTSDDGRALAHARATVHARLDGPEGRRRLAWRELESDVAGHLAFARDPALALEIRVAHPRAGGVVHWDGAAPAAVLARPAHLALRDVPPEYELAVVLDGGGQALVTHGPLGPLTSLAFHAGETPVVEVPPAARWVELRSAALGPVLVPLEASPGAELVVRP